MAKCLDYYLPVTLLGFINKNLTMFTAKAFTCSLASLTTIFTTHSWVDFSHSLVGSSQGMTSWSFCAFLQISYDDPFHFCSIMGQQTYIIDKILIFMSFRKLPLYIVITNILLNTGCCMECKVLGLFWEAWITAIGIQNFSLHSHFRQSNARLKTIKSL